MPIEVENTKMTREDILHYAALLTDEELENLKRKPTPVIEPAVRPVTLSKAIELYKLKKLVHRPDTTKVSYTITFRQFEEYINNLYGYSPLIVEIKHDDIDKYINSLCGRSGGKIEPFTQLRKLRTLKSLFSFMRNEGMVIVRPTDSVVTDPVCDMLPVALSVPEVIKIIELAGKTRNPQRDKAIVSTFLMTGCRLSELENLLVVNFNFRERSILFRAC